MYERLLVPVDGSPFSEEVLPYALGIAQVTGARVTLLRVIDGQHPHPEATRYVESIAAEMLAEGKSVPVSGDIATTILEEARRVPGTLVAMSSHGRAGLLEAMLGSVARQVLRASGGPLLVYRPAGRSVVDRSHREGIESVVLPLDGTPASEAMAPQAAEASRWLGARLVVVSVIPPGDGRVPDVPPSDTMESSYVQLRASDLGKRYGLQVGWEVLHGEPDEAIPDFVRKRPGVLLAMATRGSSGLRTALFGSVAASCLRRSGVPMLVRMPGAGTR